MREYARKEKGVIDRIFRIAETATKRQQRKIFREAIEYAKRHSHELDGILFYKIDRAARNLKDIVSLEELESDHDLPFISITQPVQNTPTGRMVRRTLATIAAFTTEQQGLDVRDGIAKRVETGWFPSVPPYRCSQYHRSDHPRIRLTEGELDAQMLALFDRLRVELGSWQVVRGRRRPEEAPLGDRPATGPATQSAVA
jgi:DNA invertase Pin-like site-specific DNA recombinase